MRAVSFAWSTPGSEGYRNRGVSEDRGPRAAVTRTCRRFALTPTQSGCREMRARDRRCLFPPRRGSGRRPHASRGFWAGPGGRPHEAPHVPGAQDGTPAQTLGCRTRGQVLRGRQGARVEKRGRVRTARQRPPWRGGGQASPTPTPEPPFPRPAGPRVAAPAAWTRRGLRAGASPLGHPRSRPHRPSDPSREGRGQRKVTPPGQSAGSATARPPVVTVRPAHARPRGVSVAPAFLHTEASAHTATAAPGPTAPQAPPSPLLRAPVPTAGSSLGCTLDPRVLRPGARRGHQASRPTGSRDPHGGGPGGSVTLFGGSGSLVRSVTVTLVPRPGRTAPAHGPCVGPSPVC